jgi:hypothetical protein
VRDHIGGESDDHIRQGNHVCSNHTTDLGAAATNGPRQSLMATIDAGDWSVGQVLVEDVIEPARKRVRLQMLQLQRYDLCVRSGPASNRMAPP